jgi:tetratricopeptide (TPR) repeat protein
LAARNELLAELAKKTSGRAAARLHMARAELSEQQGDVGSAESCRADARQAHPRDLVALRAARRDASVRGDWEQVASLLQTESELGLSGQDKAMALTALAEVQLRKLEDAAGAEKSARSAMTAHKGSIVAPLLVAEAAFAGQRDNEAMQALKLAADRWSDPKGRAALIGHVARSAEHAGQLPRARRLYAEATQADPTALDARLGLARTLRATGELDEAIETIQQAASQLQGGGSEGLRRMAARWLHLRAGRPQDAVALLDDARGLFALQTRADAAAAAGDRQAEAAAAEAWAAASGGTERALALVTLAERRAEDGDLDGADQALKDAALADSKLGTVRVVREVLARRAGDPSRLAHAVQSDAEDEGGALTAAAKLARDDRSSNEERELLARAMEEGASPETADVVGLDTAAAAAEVEATHAALRREVERAPPEHKAGPLLALGGLFSEHGQTDAAEAVLREARDAAPGDPLVLRPLARLIAPARPKEAAALWLEEASSGPAERAAFAATQAGRLLARAEADASSAFRRALDVQPSYAPAAWAMEPLARRAQDTWTLAQLQERMTEFGGPPEQVAARWVRAGLLRADEAPQQAIDNLERARELQPDDAILYELLLRLMRTDAPANRARLLETSAERIGESIELSARLRAAAAHEQAEDYASAATAYRQVLKANPEDAVARHALDWAELAAGEHARVAERRFDRVRAAPDDASRVASLESLANLDLFEREDPASAVLSLQSILEHAPDHLPTLRALERYYMEQGRTADLLWVQRQLLEHLTEGDELAGHLRLATRLRLAPEDAPGSAADEMLLAHAERVRMDLWLARRIEGAARVTQDPPRQLAPLDYVAGALVGPMEKASAHLRASEVAAGALGYDAALERLRPAVQEASDHPVVTEQLAHLAQQGDQPDEAARAFETAATHARSARRQVDLWYHAGLVWQRSGESDRALAAFEHAASIDVTHADLFEQMRQMLTGRGDTARLAELTRTRLQAGGDPVTLAELHVTEASLAEELGDREGAKEALRAALALTPERADALRRLAELSLEDEEWRPAAESLIRFARLRQGRQELHWVFSTLGDIYDHHMPDPKRAEAAYRRVLKLAPDDTDTMDRLAELYRREGQVKQATELLRDLAGREPDADKAQNYRIRLARVLEEQGDTRGAERELEQARNDAPTHLTLLRGIVDFYRRQQADSALAVHLNRAVNDFRNRITQTPTDKQAWAGLVEVLDWRGRPDAARCAASSTAALGLVDVELAKRLDAEGGAPGAGSAATDSALDELLAPEQLSLPLRQVFRLASDAIAKHVAFDPKSLRAQRVAKDSPYAAEAKRVGEWFGVGDVQVLTTTAAPRLCIPLSSSPMTVAIGRDLLQSTSERERLFLFARAVKIAATHLTVTVHAQPDELALAVGGLVRIQDSNYAPSGFETAELESVGRKVFKAVPRRLRDELAPSVLEMGGEAHFDPTRLGLAASELADRVALAAIGSTPAGLGALLKLAGEDFTDSLTPKERVAAVRRVSEAWSLLSFSISDAYFEARHRAKADSL